MSKETLSPFVRDPRDPSFRIVPQVVGGIVLAAGLLGGLGGWAAVARLEGAVIAPGIVKVEQNLKEVQHRDGGIVRAIAVKAGDTVRQGQVLLSLDEVQTRAELQIVRVQLAEALVRQARLMAERDNAENVSFPPDIADLSSGHETLKSSELRVFHGNRLTRFSQIQQLNLGIEQIAQEIVGSESRRSAVADEINLVTAERVKVLDLFQRALIAHDRVYAVNREIVRLHGTNGEIESGIARARTRINEARLQILAIEQNARVEAQKELRTVEGRIAELTERNVAISDRLSRMEIRSPIAGTVNEVTVHTVGGVITPAARLVTIVPEGSDLRVEIRVAPNDINQLAIGQSARLRFTSFQQNMTPELRGRLVKISAATMKDPATGQSYYAGEVEIGDRSALGEQPLIPGMPVEVYVSTQERTALSYMVKPVLDHVNRAFKER
jgi:HlyD family type I secretion membrane fusion protein